MADDAPLVLPTGGQDDGIWDDIINDAFREVEDRINVLRQYVLDNPPGEGGDPLSDADIAALVEDVNSATFNAVSALIISQGTDPVLTVDGLSDVDLAEIKTFLRAATTAAALAAIGAQSDTWRPAIEDVTNLSDSLAGKAPLVHRHTAAGASGTIDGLATVATTGSYNDLSNKPSIPGASIETAAPGQVFFRQFIGGEWESRSSARTDVLVMWLANGSGQDFPNDAVLGLDILVAG